MVSAGAGTGSGRPHQAGRIWLFRHSQDIKQPYTPMAHPRPEAGSTLGPRDSAHVSEDKLHEYEDCTEIVGPTTAIGLVFKMHVDKKNVCNR